MSRKVTPRGFTVVYIGGPMDGALEQYRGEAPPFLTWRRTITEVTGAGTIHRYKRSTNVGGPERCPIFIYEHEGSVLV